jgi:phenylacetate-coenzyme A ligase PaaK-like adenylate-forming protein
MGATDWYTRFVSSAAFPIHERLKGHSTVAVRRALEKSQWWSREQIDALRNERLRVLLTHACTFVPYYRDLLRECAIEPESARPLDELARIPFLTKEIVRRNVERLKSETGHGFQPFSTGGSSGQPLRFFIGPERISHDIAAKWRALRWWGVDIGDPEIVVWGSPIELGAQDRLRLLRDRILRSELLPAFDMSNAKLDEFVGRIRARHPAMLFGYPSSLALIARHAERCGVNFRGAGIKVAFVTAERLYDHQRQQIERTFGCRAANGYGGRDAGFVAHECPAGGMHLSAEDIVVEIVGRDGRAVPAGESGEIVVTHLATKDFPFIRYRTGDIGVLDDRLCPCGRGLQLLKEVQGRSTDFVVTSDGIPMHGLALIYILRELGGIEAFRIVQESLDRIRVMLVPGPGYDAAVENVIRSGFRARLGAEVTVEIERVPQIPSDPSGKFRYVSSRVGVT